MSIDRKGAGLAPHLPASRLRLERVKHKSSILLIGSAAAALVAAVGLLWSCAAAGQQGTERQMQRRTIEEVLKAHTDHLMLIPGVVGTAQGLCEGQPCIKVFVAKKTPVPPCRRRP